MNAVEVRLQGKDVVCDYGVIQTAPTAHHNRLGNTRPCFHAVGDMPRCMLFVREFIERYDMQLVAWLGRFPALVSRHGDVVTLGFDKVGPVEDCYSQLQWSDSPRHRWTYELKPLRWWDEHSADDRILLGVWPD